MLGRTSIILCAVIIFANTSPVSAKDGGVPNIALEKRCRASQKATDQLMATANPGASFDACMKSENAARDTLVKMWTTIPASVKALCINPAAYSPSYVEWVTCSEMQSEVTKLRKGQPVSIETSNGCPIVRFKQDGSIISVVPCVLPAKPLY